MDSNRNPSRNWKPEQGLLSSRATKMKLCSPAWVRGGLQPDLAALHFTDSGKDVVRTWT